MVVTVLQIAIVIGSAVALSMFHCDISLVFPNSVTKLTQLEESWGCFKTGVVGVGK